MDMDVTNIGKYVSKFQLFEQKCTRQERCSQINL